MVPLKKYWAGSGGDLRTGLSSALTSDVNLGNSLCLLYPIEIRLLNKMVANICLSSENKGPSRPRWDSGMVKKKETINRQPNQGTFRVCYQWGVPQAYLPAHFLYQACWKVSVSRGNCQQLLLSFCLSLFSPAVSELLFRQRPWNYLHFCVHMLREAV